MNRFKHPIAGRAQGFSLIEVLIALVILSVGLLGIAAMVSVSMKSRSSSYLRTQALALGSAILDRMRANHATAVTGGYNITVDASTPFSGAAQNCNGSSNTCTPAQIAAMDMYDWNEDLVNLLGYGQASNVSYYISTLPVGQFTQVQVIISWNDTTANSAISGATNSGAYSACSTASPNPASIATATGYGCYNSVVVTSGL